MNEEQSHGETKQTPRGEVMRHSGYVREWHDEGRAFGKIYGRLEGAEKGENFFFHMSSVHNPRALAKGVKVRFDISPVQSGTHRRAVNVEVVG